MNKFFNTAGPIKPDKHYYIPSRERMDWDELYHLIDNEKYFILHAPRQTGKTSALFELMHGLNQGNSYTALYINIEGAQTARNDVESGISAVCSVLVRLGGIYLNEERLDQWLQSRGRQLVAQDRLYGLLSHWAQINEKPIVLLIDEIDALIGDTLVSVLRQLRSGYNQRPGAFPQSVVLCGVRDIKDYRIHKSDGDIITGGSAFNIKSKSLTIGNFSFDETRRLLLQHSEATGQKFDEAIWPELWEDTRGQPWLVNALAYEMTYEDKEARDPRVKITLDKYRAARERLIQSRATHLDQLTDKLSEPRVHRVISAILASSQDRGRLSDEISYDDQQYLEDLGLVTLKPQIRIANRIYREVIPRELTAATQNTITHQTQWYVTEDHRLDMARMLGAFQQFFRENSEIWLERFAYKEAGPQLLLQAFLQRIINSGGRLNREYGLGRKRTDLLLEWPLDVKKGYLGPVQRIVIELKVLRGALESVLSEALAQTADYADKVRADQAHIVIFNRDPEVPWDDKIWHRQESYNNWTIEVWGC